jgi:type I restriction enzyme S subunit
MNPIKQGYKQTKVGIIPEDWEVVKLNSFIDELEAGISVNSTDEPCGETEYGILKTSSISNGNFIYTENKKIKEEEIHRAKLNPIKGNLLISRMNTPDLVGAIGLVKKTYANLFLPDRLWQTKFSSKQKIDSFWLNSLLNTNQYKLVVQSLATGTSNSMKNISKKAFLEIEIPLPPLKEQEKIAEILTTWDEAITKQTELLEAKELQKKALMQKLLSGEIRFDGFDDEWEEVRLGEICEIKKGEQLNKDTLDSDGDFPVINGGIEPSGYTEEWNTEANTITISEGGNSCGYVNFLQDRFWSGGHCYTLLNLKIDKIFLYQFLKYNQHNIMKLRVGSGLPNIQKSAIERFTINKPSFGEQHKIAEVLSIADDEINLLKNELEELKLQKKALMQKLLTGEVRVNV